MGFDSFWPVLIGGSVFLLVVVEDFLFRRQHKYTPSKVIVRVGRIVSRTARCLGRWAAKLLNPMYYFKQLFPFFKPYGQACARLGGAFSSFHPWINFFYGMFCDNFWYGVTSAFFIFVAATASIWYWHDLYIDSYVQICKWVRNQPNWIWQFLVVFVSVTSVFYTISYKTVAREEEEEEEEYKCPIKKEKLSKNTARILLQPDSPVASRVRKKRLPRVYP